MNLFQRRVGTRQVKDTGQPTVLSLKQIKSNERNKLMFTLQARMFMLEKRVNEIN